MPSNLKSLVHARMEKTGETYQQALLHVRALEEREPTPTAEGQSRALTLADTAFSIAVVRAEEDGLPEASRLFRDPYASLFGEAGAHAAEATQRFLELPFFRDAVRLRTRFIDDFLRQGLAAGLTQIVLLGAGFDSRGLRMPEVEARGASVFEVDTKHQLSRKRAVLQGAGVQVPSRIAYVPFDFDAPEFERRLAAALEAKGFRRGAGALFVLEGVIGYIDDVAIDRTFRFMAEAGGPGSRMVFTYGHGTFEHDTARERTSRAGFTSCEEVGSDELWRRYLSGDPHPNAWVVKIGTAAV